jgi:hypothetical protein
VEALVGVDPSERLLAMPHRRAIEAGVHADMLLASGMKPIPHSVNLELAGLFNHPLSFKDSVLSQPSAFWLQFAARRSYEAY